MRVVRVGPEFEEQKVLDNLRSKARRGKIALGCAAFTIWVMIVALAVLGGMFGMLLIVPMVLLMVGVLLGALRLHLKGKKAERELKYLA